MDKVMNSIVLDHVSTTTDQLIVGQSRAIRELKDTINRVANSPVSVMINGRSGTGKEMVARALHAASARAAGPFVAINCGAISPELIESELFGHERGSFTGANTRRIGRFEEANGGTLFLDEIGDMRVDMQVKLLRVLEEREVTRVGGTGSVQVNVRVISATHQNIEVAIAETRFREDLYFRLGVVPISVPDLASRVEDVPLLVAHFQKKLQHAGKVRISPDGLNRLMQHGWPGNVRELRNLVERAGVLFPGETIGSFEMEQLLGLKQANSLPSRASFVHPQSREPLALSGPADPMLAMPSQDIPIDLKALLETMELERIQFALDLADGVISDAARMLTLKRTTLIEKMRKYGVDRTC
jgi:sigma-54 dependent transcriptional regulator, flagellar regulatory protein